MAESDDLSGTNVNEMSCNYQFLPTIFLKNRPFIALSSSIINSKISEVDLL